MKTHSLDFSDVKSNHVYYHLLVNVDHNFLFLELNNLLFLSLSYNFNYVKRKKLVQFFWPIIHQHMFFKSVVVIINL